MAAIQIPTSPAPARVPCYGGPAGGVQTRALGSRSRSAFSPEVVVDYVVVGRGRGVPVAQNELAMFPPQDSRGSGADYHWPQKSAARTAAVFKSREAAMENFIVTAVQLMENLESRISNHDPTLYATGNTEIRKYGNPERRNTVPGPAPSNVPNRGGGHVCKWAWGEGVGRREGEWG